MRTLVLILFCCYHEVLAINSVNHVILLTMKRTELYDVTTELSSILINSITRDNFFVKVINLFAGQALIIVVSWNKSLEKNIIKGGIFNEEMVCRGRYLGSKSFGTK